MRLLLISNSTNAGESYLQHAKGQIKNFLGKKPVEAPDVIIAGEGNTFRLLQLIQSNNLIEPVRKKVMTGTPYIGWSAGAKFGEIDLTIN
jgi:dipeptidase E